MAWKRAGASISLSMMNFHTFLLSDFICMHPTQPGSHLMCPFWDTRLMYCMQVQNLSKPICVHQLLQLLVNIVYCLLLYPYDIKVHAQENSDACHGDFVATCIY